MDTNNIGDPAVTIDCLWGVTVVPQRQLYFPGNFGPRVVLFELNNATGGIDDLVITWTGDPVMGQLNAFATELRLGPSPDNSIGNSDANSNHPSGDISGVMVQGAEIFIGVLATFATSSALVGAGAVACTVGQNTASTGSAIIELVRVDSVIHTPTSMGLTNYNGISGALWSMITADFKLP
jgi:hypothetical protein